MTLKLAVSRSRPSVPYGDNFFHVFCDEVIDVTSSEGCLVLRVNVWHCEWLLCRYCDCFANGEFCNGCNCCSCANNLDHEVDRQRAIRACLERNPYAFHPKI